MLRPAVMRLSFGNFTFDSSERRLWRGAETVPLEPKMYQLLEILIKRRPAVVPNEELDELLWPHVYVARTSLTRLISALRAVLDDDSRDSRIIRTAYKTGYAFCAAVRDAAPAAVEPPAPASKSVQVALAAPGAVGAAAVATAAARSDAIHLVWKERIIPLGEGEFVAGRDEECAVVIDASTVSRRHAKIVVRGGCMTIEDLDSTNGTRVNGMPVTAATVIVNGNTVELGSEVLVVKKRNAAVLTVRMSRDQPTAGRA
jgi:DNA-binding winged helix-turn-helix (wHTH) protein